MSKLIYKEKLDWKGVLHDIELYESDSIEGLSPVEQVQTIPFVDDKHIVVYKHVDGYWGLPGGSVEGDESFEETLKREVKEESACEVLEYGLIGYMKDTQIESPEKEKYQLRYWAKVKLLDEPINDPCGKAISREVINLDEVSAKLNWGERGNSLVKLAVKKFKQAHSKRGQPPMKI